MNECFPNDSLISKTQVIIESLSRICANREFQDIVDDRIVIKILVDEYNRGRG